MRKVSKWLGAAAVAAALVAVPASALAQPSVSLSPAPSVTGKLGGAGTLTFTFTNADPTAPLGVPAPGATFKSYVPAGLVYSQQFPTCPLSKIQSVTGPKLPSCPAASLVATGHGTTEADLSGSLFMEQSADVNVYVVHENPIQLAFWNYGATPVQTTFTTTGTLTPVSGGKYGYVLAGNFPTIPTTPGAPNASITTLALTFKGTTTIKVGKKKKKINEITLPKKCTSKTFNWAFDETFTDGTSAQATATSACP